MNFAFVFKKLTVYWVGQAHKPAKWPEAERKEIRIRYFSLKPRDIGGVVNEHYVDTYQM